MPCSQKGGIRALIVCAIFLAVAGPLIAGGQGESRLADVDQLIAEKQYDRAIRLLVEIRDADSEQADPVQDRLDLLLSLRDEITATEEEAIQALEREDLEAFVGIMLVLDDLDPNPNRGKRELYTSLRYEAGVIVDRRQVGDVMDAALARIRNGELDAAIETYVQGLSVGLDVFRQSYGEEALDRVGRFRVLLEDAGGRFSGLKSTVEESVEIKDEVFRRVAASPSETDLLAEQLPEAVEALLSPLYELSLARSDVVRVEKAAAELREELAARRDDLADVHYLSFLGTFINGRPERSGDEGILSVMDGFWLDAAAPLEDEKRSLVETQFAAALDRYHDGDRLGAVPHFDAAVRTSELYAKALALWTSRIYVGDGLTVDEESRRSLESKVPGFVYAGSRAKLAGAHRELDDSLASYEALDDVRPEMSVAELDGLRSQALSAARMLRDRVEDVERLADEYGRFGAVGVDTGDIRPVLARLESLARTTYAKTRDLEVRVVARAAELRLADVRSIYEPEIVRVAAGRELIEGTEESIGDGRTEQILVNRYPDRGRQQLAVARERLETSLGQARTVLADYEDEEPFVLEGAPVAAVLFDGRQLENDIDGLLSQTHELISAADELLANADRFQRQTLAFLDGADAAVQERRYLEARNAIQQAQAAVVRAAEYKQDDLFEVEVNERIESLSGRIAAARTGVIIAEVRGLITDARLAYGRADYVVANNQIVTAQSRWLEVFTDTDPEIDYWLTIIQTALEVQTGRDVDVSHPLFTETQQRLNIAYRDFEEARALLAAGRRVDALRKLDSAEQEISTVRVQFPYNQQAALLNWRIMELRDPDRYASEIEALIRDARTRIRENPRTAYNDLQDLLEIVTDTVRRRRIEALIVDTEFALGLRQPPPNPVRVGESNELYRRAVAIYEERDRSNYQAAIGFLNASLEANPNNVQAQQLKDQLTVTLGGNAQFSLSVEDLRLFNEAARLFASGDAAGAYLVTRDLMERNATNRNYRPLGDLHRRLEARLFGAEVRSLNGEAGLT